MKHTSGLLIFVLILFAPFAVADVTEEFHHTYDLSSQGTVSLENVNGDVRISGGDGNVVTVDAVKKGESRSDLEEVKIEVDSSPDHLSIETRYPKGDRHHHRGVSVTYTLTVPRKANLRDIEVVNGNVKIVQVKGRIEASSINGGVDVQGIADDTELRTVNGKLEGRLDKGPKKVSAQTVNGTVTLALPSDAGAEVTASSLNGDIDSDFDLQARKRLVGSRLDGRIGDGTMRIDVETVNGTIRIQSY
jgi:DUF4097 and DUF4098 domain-containing protein YvlB